jgi:hypothetical protein
MAFELVPGKKPIDRIAPVGYAFMGAADVGYTGPYFTADKK